MDPSNDTTTRPSGGASPSARPSAEEVEVIRGQLDHIYADAQAKDAPGLSDSASAITNNSPAQPRSASAPVMSLPHQSQANQNPRPAASSTVPGRPQPSIAMRQLRRSNPTMFPIQDYRVRSNRPTTQRPVPNPVRPTAEPTPPNLNSPVNQTAPATNQTNTHPKPTNPAPTGSYDTDSNPSSRLDRAPIAPTGTATASMPTAAKSDAAVAPTAPNSSSNPAQSSAQPPQATPEEWNRYHSAWQQYYQTYYQRYYTQQMLALQQQQQQQPQTNKTNNQSDTNGQPSDPAGVSQQDAINDLRSRIRQKVADSVNKVKSSRHFIPIVAALVVVGVFVVLQYNREVAAAFVSYTSPGNIDPQNIIVDTTSDVAVSQEPRLIIPKINVDAPVIYGVSHEHDAQMTAMQKGVAHFSIPGANAVPGQIGNTVLAGHSSNDAFSAGDYKFIFAQNEKLTKDDIIYVNYEGKRYTYSVTTTEVVMPSDVKKIQLTNNKPMLTLISCVPLGTAEKRLLVFAEQISPDPKKAAIPNAGQQSGGSTPSGNIPGQPSPTFIERLFGAR